MVALSFATVLCASGAEAIAGQPGEGLRTTIWAGLGDAPTTVDETVARIDALLAQLDARTKDAWARAEEILNLADAATDSEEQMRLEELYGKMVAVAGSFEEQHSRLSALRNELAVAHSQTPP